MSVNKYLPHILVLPEDDANRQLANGFQLDQTLAAQRIQILEEAGGWREVCDRFAQDHILGMDEYAGRFMVLLVDFDARESRLEEIQMEIPERLRGRVFILGAWSEPEELRQDLGSFEAIGLALARDCRDNTEMTWRHRLLSHNAGELERLRTHVRPILFPGS